MKTTSKKQNELAAEIQKPQKPKSKRGTTWYDCVVKCAACCCNCGFKKGINPYKQEKLAAQRRLRLVALITFALSLVTFVGIFITVWTQNPPSPQLLALLSPLGTAIWVAALAWGRDEYRNMYRSAKKKG